MLLLTGVLGLITFTAGAPMVSAQHVKGPNNPTNGKCSPQDNPDDCIALVTFYWATGSKLNFTMDGSTSLCTWQGIMCNATSGRVIILDLSQNSLNGTIPSELAGLSQLQDLYLFGNSLSGTIPSELAGLSQLQDLYLYGNSLSGTIPSELAGLSQLQYLDLDSNSLSGTIPSELVGLSQLQYLSLEVNSLSGTIPSELAGLSQLQDLFLSGNSLSGTIPSELAGLSQLQYLNLDSNSLSGTIPSTICKLIIVGSLTHCDLSNNAFQCPLPLCGPACKATCA